MSATVQITEADGIAVARVTGEIDIANTSVVAESLLAQISNDALGVVLDLSGVQYIDSTGVRMLFDVGRRLRSRRRYIVVFVPGDAPVRRLFQVSNLVHAMPMTTTLDQARAQILEMAAEPTD